MSMVQNFLADESGVFTVEFVALVPFFMLFFAFFVDTCMVYFSYAEMYSAARDAARRYSTDQLKTVADIEDFIEQRLIGQGFRYAIQVDPLNIEREIIISARIFDAALFGSLLYSFVGETMSARASARREMPW